jgi:signal transduction histidine kinase
MRARMHQRDDKPAKGGGLRLTSRTPDVIPDPADGPFAIERLTTLAHELGNLLDGSMRCLGLARRSLAAARGGAAQMEVGLRQLDTVALALERMSDLVHAAMKGSASVVGSPTMNPKQPISICDAASHAIDVVTPEADEAGITIELRASEEARMLPAGPLYSVVLNGLRNALEAIARVKQSRGGSGKIDVDIARQPIPGTEVDLLIIEIADDGAGLASDGQGLRAFDFGFSTKPGGLGVGLALAREVVREAGGNVELNRRPERAGEARPGAVLKIVYPLVRGTQA